MTLIQIYCAGVVTQALYYLIKRVFWSDVKIAKYNQGVDDLTKSEGLPVRKMVPFMLVLMCLLWPYMWFERLFLKRGRS